MSKWSLSGSGAAQSGDESRAARASWRTYRVGGVLVVGAGAVFFCAAQFAAGVQKGEKEVRADAVTAGRFELIGANGKKAALLAPGPRGGGRMTFYDDKEVMRLGVGISEGDAGPELLLYDRDGKPRLSVAIPTAVGAPIVNLLPDATGGSGVTLTADKDGASLSLESKKGGGRISMRLDGNGAPSVTLDGPGGKCGISLTADGDRQWITLTQENRQPVRLGLEPDGSPVLHLSDRTGKVKSSMTIRASGVTVFNKTEP